MYEVRKNEHKEESAAKMRRFPKKKMTLLSGVLYQMTRCYPTGVITTCIGCSSGGLLTLRSRCWHGEGWDACARLESCSSPEGADV